MAAAVTSSADVVPNVGGDAMPDWMSCDLGAYRILQDVSTQIVANCESFGKHLENVCGEALKQLPRPDDSAAFDCADECVGFLSAFGDLSSVLLQLAGDLECSVKQPLQGIILSLTEERTGRMKHWRQVRSRFAELQERYGRSRQRSEAARGKLEKCDNKGKWFHRGDTTQKAAQAASEQHAAMCDLAQCEEELNATEASLRRLEDESREWLRQMSREKQAVLRGVLAKGTGSLGRFVSVAEKASPKANDPHEEQKVVTPTGWSGVLPMSTKCPEEPPADKTEEKPSTPPVPQGVIPQPEAELQEEPAEKLTPADPSAKYMQTTPGPVPLDISELSDDSDDDAAARATHWSPHKESPAVATKVKRGRSLVFMGSGSTLISQSKVTPKASAASSSPANPSLSIGDSSLAKESPAVSRGLAIGKLAALKDDPVAPATSPFDVNRRFRVGMEEIQAEIEDGIDISDISSITAEVGNLPALSAPASAVSAPSLPVAVKPPPEDLISTAWQANSSPAHVGFSSKACPAGSGTAAKDLGSPQKAHSAPKLALDFDDDDDEDELCASPEPTAKTPLEKPDVALELVPLIADNAQKCFEKYVSRLPERVSSANDIRWDKVQARANEQQLGGHVGKLECFWICRPGVTAAPDTADGIVCFQFVQGFASNFARILHLSVVGDGRAGNSTEAGRAESWPSLLPSAIFQVRHLLFETLPVDSLRAVVVAGEDDSGRIFVDSDVEVAYQRCNFRWFQLTQNLRRTKNAITRKHKVRQARFLVLHAPRRPTDPKAPRNSTIGRLPAMLLKNDSSPVDESAGETPDADLSLSFSSW